MNQPARGRRIRAPLPHDARKPGLRWALLLGGCGFAAGFFGPLVFVPEANQGPLVGILISGPLGAVLGLVLLGLCTALRVSAHAQWRMLTGTAIVGSLAVLFFVQPEPALLGYVMDLEVESCARPIDAEPQVLDYWSKRIAEVTWAAPRPGWRQEMHRTLLDAPGAILQVKVRKEISVRERRKPWNRGALFATAGRNAPGETAFYDSEGTCTDYPAGRVFSAFEKYGLDGPIRPPQQWPPGGLGEILHVSPILPVPARFQPLR